MDFFVYIVSFITFNFEIIDSCFLTDFQIPLNDMLNSSVKTPSALDCQIECRNQISCQFFSYSTSSKDCILKYSDFGGQVNSGWVTGPKWCDRSQTCFHLDVASNLHDFGSPILADSAYYCQAACQLNTHCLYFFHLQSSKYCYFKSGSDGTFIPYLGAVSGQKFCEDSYCFTDDLDYPGGNGIIIPYTKSATHCQWECQQEATCLRFAYDRTNGRCVFKSGKHPAPARGITVGPKFCTETKKTDCFTSNMDHPGPDLIVFLGVQSSADCQAACQINSACVVFCFVPAEQKCVLKATENPTYSAGIIAGPKFCKEKRKLKFCPAKLNSHALTAFTVKKNALSMMICAGLYAANCINSKRCSAFAFNETTKECELFLLGPYSYSLFKSDETKSDIIYMANF